MDNDLISILEKFSHLKVLVFGEAILNSTIRGKANRLCLDQPAPVIGVREGEDLPGGAAYVAATTRRLGAQVTLLSVIGQDADGDILVELLQEEDLDTRAIIRHPNRRTLLKRRVFADAHLVVRYDQGCTEAVDAETENRLLGVFDQLCDQVDVVILSDYGQGVLTHGLLERIAEMQHDRNCMIVADTRRFDQYRGLRLLAIRPSYLSAMDLLAVREDEIANDATDPLEKLSVAGERILETLDTQIVAITLDDNGALVLNRDSPIYRTYAPEMPFNRVDGAGDAFISVLALSLAARAQAPAAAEIASAAASIVVKNQGSLPCCSEELRAHLAGDQKYIEDWGALGARLEALRRQGKRIVFTNGVFDILHSAHVAYLNQAKSQGDILVLGVNSDASVKRLKGPNRPINGLTERCRVLAGLSCVDFVAPFSENNPIPLIHVVRPDVYVKGGDYTRETLPEAEIVESYGGELRIVPYIANHSTTGVIERIRKLSIPAV